jgi:hypothetical protein
MMRRCYSLLAVVVLALLVAFPLAGGTFKLEDGTTIYGELSGFDDAGAVFRLDSGGFSQRVPWSKFTQDSLKDLAENNRVRPLVEPFIEIPPEAKPKPRPIVLKDVPKVDLPGSRTTFFSSLPTPLGLFILGLLYLANLFAAYEVAVYRNRPAAVVCGVSAVLPLLGPLAFLASPTLEAAPEPLPDVPPPPPPTAAAPPAPAAPGSLGTVGVPPPPTGGGLRVAAQQEVAAGAFTPKVFKRGEVMINRRFVETQFSGFFRMVPLESERDLVLVVKTAKNEYVGKRISRITAGEFFLVLLQGGQEVSISFGEVAQIVIQHKDNVGK